MGSYILMAIKEGNKGKKPNLTKPTSLPSPNPERSVGYRLFPLK